MVRPTAEQLRAWYEDQRLTTRAIAGLCGATKTSVRRWLIAAGIERRPGGTGLASRGVEPPTGDELHRMIHVEHLSYEVIAGRYGVDATAIPHWLDKHGIGRSDCWTTRRKGIAPIMPTVANLKARYEAGETFAQIAVGAGVSKTKMREFAVAEGIQARPPGLRFNPTPLPAVDELGSLYESGVGIEEIADRYDRSPATIYKLFKKHGVEVSLPGYNGGRRYVCNDGLVVLSVYERRVCDWLSARAMAYEYEPRLPWGHRARADFLVNGWYVEIWGVNNHKSYLRRRDRKMEQYRRLGLPLISISRKNLHSRTGTWKSKLLTSLVPPSSLGLHRR